MRHHFLSLILALIPYSIFAQPANDNCTNAMPLVVDAPCSPATNIGATNDGNPSCSILSFLAGKTVWFSFVATGSDTKITVSNISGDLDAIMSVFTTCGASSLNCVNADSVNRDEFIVMNTVSGTSYYVMVDGYRGVFGIGAHPTGNFCIQVSTYIAPQNPTGDCAGAQPFCTGSTYSFPAATNTQSQAGPNYGCLATQPNPAWYYIRIATSGSIDIHLVSDVGQDLDFICWGPFTSPINACNQLSTGAGTQVDCSYSTAAEEDCNIPNAQVGEYYMLLITNYSNQPTNIIFSQTGGTGASDCSIINPIHIQNNGPLCQGQTLSINATNIYGASYSWVGPYGFTSSIRNPVILNASPTASGIYILTATIDTNTYTAATYVTVFSASSPECMAQVSCITNVLASPDTICEGNTTTLSVNGVIFNTILSSSFNNGVIGIGWAGSPTANFTNPACAGVPPYNSTFLWMDNTTPAPRRLESNDFNVINGGNISFWLKFATQGQGAPCEGPDESGEGVTLQYSTTSGSSWTDITYFSPNGTQMATNPDPSYTNHTQDYNAASPFLNWARYSFPIPASASTNATRFRWYQQHSTDANTDNWGLDSILIKTSSSSLNYTWSLNGNIVGASSSVDVSPIITSSFLVSISDGSNFCYDSVKVMVHDSIPPTPVISQNGNVLTSSATIGNQWYRNDVLILNATNQNYTLTDDGFYYVIVTTNACSSNPSNSITITNLEEISELKNIRIFPNPAINELIIESYNAKQIQYEVCDITGLSLYKSTIDKRLILDMTKFKKGTYLIKIHSENEVFIRKFVKL